MSCGKPFCSCCSDSFLEGFRAGRSVGQIEGLIVGVTAGFAAGVRVGRRRGYVAGYVDAVLGLAPQDSYQDLVAAGVLSKPLELPKPLVINQCTCPKDLYCTCGRRGHFY